MLKFNPEKIHCIRFGLVIVALSFGANDNEYVKSVLHLGHVLVENLHRHSTVPF